MRYVLLPIMAVFLLPAAAQSADLRDFVRDLNQFLNQPQSGPDYEPPPPQIYETGGFSRYHADSYQRRLGLSPDQTERVRQVFRDLMRDARDSGQFPLAFGPAERRVRHAHDRIVDILNPGQRAAFEQRRWEWLRRDTRDMMTNVLRRQLSLTNEQTQQASRILGYALREYNQIRNQYGGDDHARRQALRDLSRAVDERISQLLSNEQRARFEDMRDREHYRYQARRDDRRRDFDRYSPYFGG